MSQGFTSQMARNIFYGGTMFFVLLFAALIFHTETKIPERSKSGEITEAVVRGKHLWETRNCIGCHTLLGEGAYFAPELGNVYERRGPDFIKGWIKAMPRTHPVAARCRSSTSPTHNSNDLVEFLRWTNGINTEKWPPNIEG
jgi:nitric oxide reductase subunit C